MAEKEAAEMRNPTAIMVAVLALVLGLMSSIFQVNESQTAIVLNLGKVVRTGLKPGLHFKWPVVESVRKFDRRILSLDDAPERYLTAEKKDVEVDFFVKWRIKDVTAFYRATSGGSEAQTRALLTPIVKNTLRDDINQLTLQQVVSSGRSELTQRLLKPINAAVSTLGIEVVDVRIKRINLPQDSQILDSVFDRMSTERQQVANALRAEGVAEAESIRAGAERERVVILADAEREAQTLRGEGDAKAAEIGAAAYGQDAEFYAFYRSLEAYRVSMADGKTVMVLDPDSEFLRYFGRDGR
jgi:membrane protease subunit HflC